MAKKNVKKQNNNKLYLFIISLVTILILSGFLIMFEKNKEPEITDAIKIKEEYEALNDTYAFGSVKYNSIILDEENPFVYKTADEIVDILKNGTGIIYLGYPKCPWCRNAVNVLQHLNVDEIYYLDMTNERNSYSVKNGELQKDNEGTKQYYEILKLLDEHLLDYEITDNDKVYNVGEKRVYVPMVIGVLNGKVVGTHIDIVDLEEGQTAFDVLNKEQQEKLLDIYDEIRQNVYGSSCDIESKHGC